MCRLMNFPRIFLFVSESGFRVLKYYCGGLIKGVEKPGLRQEAIGWWSEFISEAMNWRGMLRLNPNIMIQHILITSKIYLY